MKQELDTTTRFVNAKIKSTCSWRLVFWLSKVRSRYPKSESNPLS